jgi:acyl-coenzyme A thioesterase PaaI-like protein
VTGSLNVNYRKFIPLNSIVKLEASVEREEGRKIFLKAKITNGDAPPNEVVHADATSLFIKVPKNRKS